jgi:hypothetical protein
MVEWCLGANWVVEQWKLGHREAVKDREQAERTVRDLNVRAGSVRERQRDADGAHRKQEGEPLALCVLDGDGCLVRFVVVPGSV